MDELDEERAIREEFEQDPCGEGNRAGDGAMTVQQIGQLAVDREESARREVQTAIVSLVEEKVFGLSLALAKEKKLREEEEDM